MIDCLFDEDHDDDDDDDDVLFLMCTIALESKKERKKERNIVDHSPIRTFIQSFTESFSLFEIRNTTHHVSF